MPQLGTILDDMSVGPAGGHSIVFEFVPWGRHFDRGNWAATKALITAREATHPRRPSDMGGGASQGQQIVDVHAYWEDDDDLTDPDAFKRAVRAAIEALVRANEKDFTDAYYVFVDDSSDLSNLIGDDGTAPLANHLVVTLRAKTVEVYG